MATKTRKITLAAPYTDDGGKHHKAGATVEVELGEASRLLFEGLARKPENKSRVESVENKKGA